MGESAAELVKKYVLPLAQPGDVLSITAKVMAMCTGNVRRMEDMKLGFFAKHMAGFVSAVTRPFGVKGLFYKICGHGVAGIDGFYFRSSFDRYKTLALINPEHPVELSNEIEKECGIPIVIMDANDIDQNQLGKCDDFPLTDDQIQDAMKDNPSGQGGELTPLILIRPLA